MKDRIIKIMERERLTPSLFAESVGIQRSAFSHIINGRNNPSLDVVMKIHQRYEYVNLEWLLYGRGEMINENKISDKIQPNLFDENPVNAIVSAVAMECRKETEAKTTVITPNDTVKEVIRYIERPQRKIIEIRIFFDDNTFEIFKGDK